MVCVLHLLEEIVDILHHCRRGNRLLRVDDRVTPHTAEVPSPQRWAG